MNFLDFEGAFDSVDQTAIFSTLHRRGMCKTVVHQPWTLHLHTCSNKDSWRTIKFSRNDQRYSTRMSRFSILDELCHRSGNRIGFTRFWGCRHRITRYGKLCDLDYASNFLCSLKFMQYVWRADSLWPQARVFRFQSAKYCYKTGCKQLQAWKWVEMN